MEWLIMLLFMLAFIAGFVGLWIWTVKQFTKRK